MKKDGYITTAEYKETMTEKEFQRTVEEVLDLKGWWHIHFPRMWGNPSGFPDLLCLKGDSYRLIELKTASGPLTKSQKILFPILEGYGVTVHVIRPTKEDEERLNALLE